MNSTKTGAGYIYDGAMATIDFIRDSGSSIAKAVEPLMNTMGDWLKSDNGELAKSALFCIMTAAIISTGGGAAGIGALTSIWVVQ